MVMIKQVRFRYRFGEGEVLGGIQLENGNVICGCCGGVFEPDEVEIIEVFDHWVDISDEIIGE
jgi:transcription elongation factor Elf1